MSKLAKTLWLVGGLSFAVLVIVRYILGGWTTNWLFAPLGIAAASFLVALIVDYKFYLEFLTLKTTKHGMNMGVMIVLVVALLVAVNYLGKKYTKSWDLSEEKLNSLSQQTIDVLKNLDKNLVFVGFYRGGQDQNMKEAVSQSLVLFKQNSDKVDLRFVNSLVELDEAQRYLGDVQDKQKFILFATFGEKKVRVEEPFSEENIVSAMIKVTRDKQKTIYFLTGHGEKSIKSDGEEGIQFFKQRLESASYIAKELNLFSAQTIPTDADIIAIVGPQTQIQEGERKLLIEYAQKGGKLFIAADPGQKHGIALLTKVFGIEFKNNYILDIGLSNMLGRGPTAVLGIEFDGSNDITKKFIGRQNFTIFELVSEVVKEPTPPEGFNVTEIIKSSGGSFVINELRNVKRSDIKEQRAHSFAVVSEGKLKDSEGKEGSEFAVAVFGDSDFLLQKNIIQGLNVDLALNAMGFLAKESDLISIQPKAMAQRTLTLTSTNFNIIVVLGIFVPIFFFIASGTIWFRRRSA